jgi:outer membrane protein OmpU
MKTITKGKNMNNLKKIGLSALAGSLVAFSANAVEMSVSGTSEITYTSTSGNSAPVTGNPYGANTSVSFSGSGNVGWADVTIVRTLNDGIATALSAYQTMDMGDMGKISLDSIGGGLEGLTAYDDKLPTAYEEMWNGVSSSGISGAASNDTLGYSNTYGGVGISLAYSKGGTAGSSDGGSGAEAVTGSTMDWHLSYSPEQVEGLTIMHGRSTVDKTLATANDDEKMVTHFVYSMGPISAGYRNGEVDAGGTATDKEIDAFSIAFNVNDNLSVSAGTQDTKYDRSSATDTTETVDGISASYTMGATSIRAHFSESSNDAGVDSADAEYMEISLMLSF